MKNIPTLTLLVLFSLFCSSLIAQDANTIVGTWLTSSKEAKITITKKGDLYFGKISWLKEPNNPDGTPKTDTKNENENLRNTPILGYQILNSFKWNDGKWEDGTIYDPKKGSTYDCVIEAPEKNVLEVRGYIGFSMFGRTDTWTRTEN